jgi:glycosyltransferase involved in cell wall biosynthesis
VRRFLVQPEPGGRVSGGYLYNQRMAEHAPADRPLALVGVRGDFAVKLSALGLAAGDVVLADSLFLHPERIAPFAELRARGVRVGAILHAFPSFVERATAGLASSEPTAAELFILDGLDFAIVPGPYLEGVLDGRTATAIHVCPPGIDRAWRLGQPPAPRHRALPALASAGAVTPIKGFDDLLDALVQLVPRRFTWTIAGSTDVDPDHVASLRRRIRSAGLTDKVQLVGQISVDRTRELFDGADLIALGSHSENHPLVAMEALARCVPFVGYDTGGTAAIVEHGATGLLAPHRDIGALAGSLARLLDDADLRRNMAEACWHRRDRLISWTEAADRLATALDR